MKHSIFIFLMIISSMAASDDGSKITAALEFLEVIGTEKQINETIERMVDLEVSNNPGLIPYKHILIRFYNEHIGYEVSRFQTAELYAEFFTLEEIKELQKFHQTEVGKKLLAKTPEILQRSSKMNIEAVQMNIYELQEMIKDESLRIQKLQNSSP